MKNILEKVIVTTLSNKTTLAHMSGHPIQFSDGTVAPSQPKEVIEAFKMERYFEDVKILKGMQVVAFGMKFSPEQVELLRELAKMVDVVALPFPVLASLREMGIREQFGNCFAMISTEKTAKSPPDQKVYDINKWSW